MARCTASLLFLGACSFTGPLPGNTPDGPDIGNEAGSGAEMQPPAGEAHLLITEILANGNAEFVEIHNPTDATVVLTDYYLTDVATYWQLPAGGTIAFGNTDYFMRFPAGASMAPGATVVVAVEGDAFLDAFGVPPTFTIDTPVTGAMPMIQVIPPTNTTPGNRITDAGELIVLFEWDGERDLVTDVDVIVHGMPQAGGNELTPKGSVDGPDADADVSMYAPEPNQMSGMTALAAGEMFSYKRIMFEGANEPAANGNGIDGHDETRENLQLTWDTGSQPRTPGTVALP